MPEKESIPAEGIKEIKDLLSGLTPELLEERFVFTSHNKKMENLISLAPISLFVEKEGISAIIEKKTADEKSIPYDGVFSCISLKIHSSLEAVGLTAAISTALGEAGISANIVAAFFHDHVFIPQHRAEEALSILTSLS